MGRFSQLETAGQEPEDGGASPAEAAPSPKHRIVRPPGTRPAAEGEEPDHDGPGTIAQAEQAYYSGEWDRALRLYSRAIQMDSTVVAPWVGQVYALLRLKQNTEALTWANRALEVFPDDPDLLSARGVVFASQGMVRRAVGASDFAISKGGTLAAWLARGEILLAAGNRNAMACFDKALEQAAEDDWKTPAHIGLALTARKKYPGAFDYLQRSVQRKGNNAFLWHELGRAAERLRFNEQALQAYERARDLAPDNQGYKRSLERFHGSGPLQKLFRMLRGGD